MKMEIKNNSLTICLPERVSVDNIEVFEQELLGVPVPEGVFEIILDGSALSYISSVGFRVLLRYKKQQPLPIRVTELNTDIYDIFSVTGFADLLQAERALRYVDVKGLKELGRGMYGSVYRVNDEQILKVFHGINSREALDGVLHNVKTAFTAGIPTMIPFDTVKTDRGLGMVFELVTADSLADLIHGDPGTTKKYAGTMAELALLLSQTEFADGSLKERNEMLKAELSSADFLLTKEEQKELMDYVECVPRRNTAVHGDFHARNVMMQGGEPLLIDMDDFCMGHPIWDLACLYRVYPYLYSLDQKKAERLLDLPEGANYPDVYYQIMHLSIEEAKTFWAEFLFAYFAKTVPEAAERYLAVARIYSDFMVIRFLIDQCRAKDDPKYREEKHALIREILSRMGKNDMQTMTACLSDREDKNV